MKAVFILILLILSVACGKGTRTKYVQLQPADTRMTCKVYDVVGASSLPDFSSLEALGSFKTARVNNPSTSPSQPMQMLSGTEFESHVEQFGLVCEGELNIEQTGSYVFYLNSDDGSKLTVNGITVLTNDGLHGMIKKNATLSLTKGSVRVKIEYFNNFGQKGLVFSVKEPAGLEEVARFWSLGVTTPLVTQEAPLTPPWRRYTEGRLNAFPLFLLQPYRCVL